MKKLLGLLILVFAFTFMPQVARADLSSTDIHELNNATPGTQKIYGGKGLGTMLQGSRMTGVYGGNGQANTSAALGNITQTSVNTTLSNYRVIIWNVPTASGWSFVLPNGTSGQDLTIIRGNSSGKAGTVTPTTKTGFTDLTFTNQGDGVTLTWHDSTGWIPDSAFGTSTNTATINP